MQPESTTSQDDLKNSFQKFSDKVKSIAIVNVNLFEIIKNLKLTFNNEPSEIIKKNESENTNNRRIQTGIKKFVWNFSNYKDYGIDLIIPNELNTKIFDETYFLKNYQLAFEKKFEQKTLMRSNSKIIVNFVNYPNSELSNLHEGNYSLNKDYFRLITCIYFSIVKDIQLTNCSCYPENLNELNLFKSNIKMNCIKETCSSEISLSSNAYNRLTVGNCDKINVQNILMEANMVLDKSNFAVNISQSACSSDI